jgi:hypothetical protein
MVLMGFEQDSRRQFRWGLVLIVAAFAIAITFATKTCQADVAFEWSGERAQHEERIDAWLVTYFSKCSPYKLRRARAVLPALLEVCEREKVNPYLVAAIVTLESTWDVKALGKLGERGLMQVMRGDAVPSDAAGQIGAGVAILRKAFERCGTTEGAVSLYATGSSCRPYRGTALRLRLAEEIERG